MLCERPSWGEHRGKTVEGSSTVVLDSELGPPPMTQHWLALLSQRRLAHRKPIRLAGPLLPSGRSGGGRWVGGGVGGGGRWLAARICQL